MKIFSAGDIRQIDQDTIEQEGITSLDLIERAASAFVYEITSQFPRNKHICIFAGPGNNGSDALAIARLLMVEGYNPQIYFFITSNQVNPNTTANNERLKAEFPNARLDEVTKTFRPPHLSADTLVIDGLFGTGLNKPLAGGFRSLV